MKRFLVAAAVIAVSVVAMLALAMAIWSMTDLFGETVAGYAAFISAIAISVGALVWFGTWLALKAGIPRVPAAVVGVAGPGGCTLAILGSVVGAGSILESWSITLPLLIGSAGGAMLALRRRPIEP